jgi:hypothetical protein
MILDNEGMKSIRKALHKRVFDMSQLLADPYFDDDVSDKTAAIYSKANDDPRDRSEVYMDVLTGELGEYGIYRLLKEAGLDVVYNEEELTREYWWDLCVIHDGKPLYGEIKFQGTGFKDEAKTTFAFHRKNHDQHMRENWKKLDFIIAFYIKSHGEQTLIVPWLLIDSQAIDPSLNLYQVSQYNNGYYLKMQLAQQKNLFDRLNNDSNLFTFK